METAIRTTGSLSEANEWVLVLTAAGIPHRIESSDAGWTLLVPAAAVVKGRAALRAYEKEARPEPATAPPDAASSRTAWKVGLGVGLLLLAFFFVTGPPTSGSPWFLRGAAVSGSMLTGEPWRAVTALTLHADLAHVLGNAIATALLLPPIVRRLGPGGGLGLVILAGAVANLIGAAVQGAQHIAIGASTATFGAIGILAALRLRPGSRAPTSRGRRWIVPVASVLLLTLLGTGQGTDVVAHALGLATGGALGLAATVPRRAPAAPIQWVLVAAAALAIAGCWCVALAGSAG